MRYMFLLMLFPYGKLWMLRALYVFIDVISLREIVDVACVICFY